MITTTAKQPECRMAGAAGLPAVLKLAPLALAAMLMSAECRADWTFKPSMEVRETYTDNVALQRDEVAHNQFISEAAPGFSLVGNGPRLTLSANAQFSKFAYSDKEAPNLFDSARRYQATAQAKVVDDLFYIDAGANGARQSVSAFGPLASNPYATANSTDVNTWRVSPYLVHRFGATATMTARFTRDGVDADQSGYGSSVASTRSLDLASGAAFTDLGWSLVHSSQDEHNSVAGRSSFDTSNAELRWRVIPRLSLTSSLGYDDYEYAAFNERTAGRSWTAGFIWVPSTRTSVQASFGHRYFGKTGALNASHRTRHSVWSLVYNDQVTTTRSQFLLPAAIDTAAMLDRLLSATFPDPVQRRQAVQAYIAATGLPPTLADSVNYLSNRYVRAKRLQGAAIFRGARTNLTLTLFGDERQALSIQQSDSNLLGNQLATLNDNVRQVGASADVDYRLSSRTNAQLSLYAVRARSLDTDIVNNNHQIRLAMTRRFDARIRGNIELRHARGNLGFVGNDVYHENAIAATLSVQY